MNIEQLAKQLFEYYGLRENGIKPDWRYLNKERQLAWIEDVHLIADQLLKQLKKKVKPLSSNQDIINTSYNMGFLEGTKQERVNFINLIEHLEQDIEDQISIWKDM